MLNRVAVAAKSAVRVMSIGVVSWGICSLGICLGLLVPTTVARAQGDLLYRIERLEN